MIHDFVKPVTVQVDWALNAHAAQLAIAAYTIRCSLYQPEAPIWTDLSGEAKQAFIRLAAEWLKDLEPEKCTYGCGRYREPGSDFCGDGCRIFSERG